MTIDFSKARLYDGDFIFEEDFSDNLNEDNDGEIVEDGWMQFEIEGIEGGLSVEFVQEIAGYFTFCPGDYWTPPDCSFELTKADFEIQRMMIDDVEVESTPELQRLVERLVEAEIQKRKRRG